MCEENSSNSCFSQAKYNNIDTDANKWQNSKNTANFTNQLEHWNKVRQSLYSLNGWCSDNVNQISKWDVGDQESSLVNVQERRHETGTFQSYNFPLHVH